MIKSGTMRRAGHAARMGYIRNAKPTSVRKAEVNTCVT